MGFGRGENERELKLTMKKYLLIALAAVVVLAGGAGAAWWKFGRGHDPMVAAQAYLKKGDTRAAIIELRNAVRTQPENAEAHRLLGIQQLRAGDPVAAEKELKAARDRGAKEADLPLLLAQSYLQQNRGKELLAEFNPPADTPELTSELLVLRAFAQVAQKDPDAAKASLAEAERLAPKSPNPRLASARIAIGRRDFDLAEQKVNEALQLGPHRPDALVLKAQILNAKGNPDGAIDALNAALDVNPKYWVARLERANLLIIKGDDKAAQSDVALVLADQPNSIAGIYMNAILLTRSGEYSAADIAFDRLSTVMNRLPRGFYFQAIAKYNLGQTAQAIDSATHYTQRNPTDNDGVKLLARILLGAGRGAQAQTVLTAAVKKGMADAETLDLLGRSYAVAGQPTQAVANFNKAVAMAPQNADILTHLASAKLNAGDPIGAESDLSRSMEMEPGKSSTAEALVVAALAAGEFDKAAKALGDLRTMVGDTETVGFLNGTLLMKKQDYPAAQTEFVALIKQFPTQTRPKLAYAQLLLLQDRTEEAKALLADALHQEPTNETVLGALLQIDLAQGHPDQAVSLMEAAQSVAPNNQSFLIALSDLYVSTGTPEKSLALLDKAQKPEGDAPPPVLEARARAQLALKQNAAALETYRKVLAQLPGNTDVLRQIVALQIDAKNWDGARRTLHDALAARPGDGDLLRSLVGVAFAEQGEDSALAEIKKLQADPVNRDGARLLVPDLAMFTKHYLQAAEQYDALLKITPSTALALKTAQAYQEAGEAALARKTLSDWLVQQPNDVDVARTLAGLEIENKQYDVARTRLENLLKLQPNDASSLNNLAWVYGQQNDPRALETARQAFAMAPTPQTADTLGWLLMTHGDAANSLPLLTQASQAMPGDPSVQFHYAAALKANGKADQAVGVLRPIATQTHPFDEQPAARKMLSEMAPAK
jgi:putative PEP-CTERM system TPR-repeat lipoprotein